jgi:hypothetical protein
MQQLAQIVLPANAMVGLTNGKFYYIGRDATLQLIDGIPIPAEKYVYDVSYCDVVKVYLSLNGVPAGGVPGGITVKMYELWPLPAAQLPPGITLNSGTSGGIGLVVTSVDIATGNTVLGMSAMLSPTAAGGFANTNTRPGRVCLMLVGTTWPTVSSPPLYLELWGNRNSVISMLA